MTLSVIVPAYNHGPYVEECLRSVLAQPADLEVVVVDDGSTDDTPAVLERIDDPRVRVLSHPGRVNRGLHETLRLGVRAATGDVLGFLASDDRWDPAFTEVMLPALAGAGAVYGQARLVSPDGDPTGEVWGSAPWGRSLFHQLLLANVVPAGTILMRRAVHDRVGGITGSESYEDLDMMLRVSAVTRVRFVDREVVDYRTGLSGLRESLDAAGQARLAYLSAVRRTAGWSGLPRWRRGAARSAVAAWEALVGVLGEGPLPTDVPAGAVPRLTRLAQLHRDSLAGVDLAAVEERPRLLAAVRAGLSA